MGDARVMDGPGQAPPGAGADFTALVERLLVLSKSGLHLGLEPMYEVMTALGRPELSFPSVHVAGSNGKGSTCAFLAAILSARSRPVGLYTSPHLSSLTERIQLVEERRFRELPASTWVRAAQAVEAVAPGFGRLSFFEVITALAMVALAEARPHAAVVEAGLGARLDATRLVDARVSVLTDLALEHTEILGDTLEKIAEEKSAVLRPGRPLVSAGGPAGVITLLERAAAAQGSPLLVLGRHIDVSARADGAFDLRLPDRALAGVELALLGEHQGRNALLAATAAVLFDPSLTDEELRAGLAAARWPGRMEILPGDPPVLLDGAHNAHGAQALARGLARHAAAFPPPHHLVLGVLGDKDADRMLAALGPLARSLTLTRPSSPRARDPAELQAGLPAELRRRSAVRADPGEALEAARNLARAGGGRVVVAGSLYLVGEIRSLLGARSGVL